MMNNQTITIRMQFTEMKSAKLVVTQSQKLPLNNIQNPLMIVPRKKCQPVF